MIFNTVISSGGGTPELVTGTLTIGTDKFGSFGTVFYVDPNGSLQEETETSQISVPLGTIIGLHARSASGYNQSGGIQKLASDISAAVFFVTGDFSLTIS